MVLNISLCWSLLLLLLATRVSSFATPKSEFLLQVDGNSVDLSTSHICVLEQKQGTPIGGRARCWGEDFHDFGHVDNIPTDVTFVQISTADSATCGVALDQTVHCWGRFVTTVPGLFTQISMSSAGSFGCGILIDGNIKCWGATSLHDGVIPRDGRRFLQISCAARHCCVLDDRGYPDCFAADETSHRNTPTLTYKEFLDSKQNAGLIVKENQDDIYEDEEEEVGGVAKKDSEVGLVQFRQVSVSTHFSCGITLLGANILCWGTVPNMRSMKIPRQIKGPFKQVSAGECGVCAITADPQEILAEDPDLTVSDAGSDAALPDQLRCWGNVAFFVNPQRFEAWDQIAVGVFSACGVSMESELDCFGNHIPSMAHQQFKDVIVA